MPDEIFIKFVQEGFFDNFPTLVILAIAEEQEITQLKNRLKLMGLSHLHTKNTIFVHSTTRSDIQVNSEYNVLFPENDINAFVEGKVYIKHIVLDWQKESSLLYKGYSAICLLDFEMGIPKCLENLPVYNVKIDNKFKNYAFYLSQKELLCTTIELIKK